MANDLPIRDTAIEAAISRVPQWSGFSRAHYERIEGGLTNRSYRVAIGGEKYVLRVNAPNSSALGLDRHHEHEVLKAAERAGIGPELVYCSPEEGLLVTRWLEGTCWSPADIEKPENLQRLAARLRDIHALPASGKSFDPAAGLRRYISLVRDARIALPSEAHELEHRTRGLVEDFEATHLCHNDVVCSNIIDGGSLRVVDWEYAAMGDPLFDVATIARYHRFSRGQADYLLEAYTGGASPRQRARFAGMQTIFDALHLFWLFAQKATAKHNGNIDQSIERLLAFLGEF